MKAEKLPPPSRPSQVYPAPKTPALDFIIGALMEVMRAVMYGLLGALLFAGVHPRFAVGWLGLAFLVDLAVLLFLVLFVRPRRQAK